MLKTRAVTLAMLVILMLNTLVLSPASASAAVSSSNYQQVAPGGTGSEDEYVPPAPDPNWELVAKADPYVVVEGRTARLDRAIYQVLTREEVAEVQRMVYQFNNLTDEQYRYQGTFEYGDDGSTTRVVTPTTSTNFFATTAQSPLHNSGSSTSCKNYSSHDWKWFGLQVTVNECLGRKIIEGVNHPAVTAFLAAVAAIKPLGGIIATAIKIHLAVYKGWMNWASNYCGNKGFEINATVFGVITISRVCKKFG
jgi:hypothetical protein